MKGFNKPLQDCKVVCGWEAAISQNYEVLEVINKYFASYFTDGSISLYSIEKSFEFEGIELNYINIQKVLIFINSYLTKQQE